MKWSILYKKQKNYKYRLFLAHGAVTWPQYLLNTRVLQYIYV